MQLLCRGFFIALDTTTKRLLCTVAGADKQQKLPALKYDPYVTVHYDTAVADKACVSHLM